MTIAFADRGHPSTHRALKILRAKKHMEISQC